LSFRHTLLKEIYEQPLAIKDTIEKGMDKLDELISIEHGEGPIIFLGMGSSYFASLYAKSLFSGQRGVCCDAVLASEYLYYPRNFDNKSLIIAISQSGESIETVKAVKKMRSKRLRVWALTNSPGSTLAELANGVLLTYAGEERGSSTKTFVSTLALLNIFKFKRSTLADSSYSNMVAKMYDVSRFIRDQMDSWENDCCEMSKIVDGTNSIIILGRGYNYYTALQASLLFKEVSKIHAEAMSGGNFRHGPIELVSPNLLTISIAAGRTKSLSHKIIRDIKNLGGKCLLIAEGEERRSNEEIYFKKVDEALSPLLSIVPLQLLVYHSALRRGRDPDSPQYMEKITTKE